MGWRMTDLQECLWFPRGGNISNVCLERYKESAKELGPKEEKLKS